MKRFGAGAALALAALAFCCGTSFAGREVKVGVRSFPPLIKLDNPAAPKGLFIDLTNHVAQREGWTVRYVTGTFSECYARLDAGTIDLIACIGYSKSRSKIFDFSKDSIFVDWGLIYKKKGSPIEKITDLEGKTVSYLKGSMYTEGFLELLKQANVRCTLKPKDEYAQILESVGRGESDAGISTDLLGLFLEDKYDIERTAIMFSPVKLMFAVKKGTNGDIIRAINSGVARFRADENSFYHQKYNKWLELGGGNKVPRAVRLSLAVAGLCLVVMGAFSGMLKRQVRLKTAELAQRNRELQAEIAERSRVEAAVRESETKYRQLFENMTAGFALHEMIFDERGWAVDYRYLEVNPAFERVTGIPVAGIVGRTVREILPGMEQTWIDRYARVVLTGEPAEFQSFSRELGRHYDVRAFRPAPGQFAVVFNDDTERMAMSEALRQNANLMRNIINSSADLIYVKDASLRMILVNDALARVMGKKPEELYGKTNSENGWPSETAREFESTDREALSGKMVHNESERVYVNGELRYFDTILIPLRDDTGRILGVLGISRDITGRRKTEEALKKSEQKLRSIIEQSLDGVAIWDQEGTLVEWSPGYERLSGIPKEDAVGKPVWEVFERVCPPGQRPAERCAAFKAEVQGLLNGGTIPPDRRMVEYPIQTLNGAIKTVQSVRTPMLFQGERLFCSITRDVTEFNRTRELSHEYAERFRVIGETINMAIAIVDPQMRIVVGNRQMRAWYPQLAGAGTQLCYTVLHPGQEGPCPACPVCKTLQDGREHESIIETTINGGQCYIRQLSAPVKDADGNISAVVKIMENITERQRAEAQLSVYQEKLRALTLEAVLIEERERKRIAEYLHDNIGQALAVAKLRLKDLFQRRSSLITDADRGILRCLDESIDFTRSLTFELSVPILYELGFEAALEWLVDHMHQQYGIEFKVMSDGSGDRTVGDVRVILFRIVRELCMNVIKHAGVKSGEITVTGSSTLIVLSVYDNGKGFAKTAGDLPERASFGMFSLREQVRSLGGQLSIDSQPGNGTRVTVTLPFSRQAS